MVTSGTAVGSRREHSTRRGSRALMVRGPLPHQPLQAATEETSDAILLRIEASPRASSFRRLKLTRKAGQRARGGGTDPRALGWSRQRDTRNVLQGKAVAQVTE
ncbi:hypothetical protein NDU88_003785 [Pleurodeles waltl]|uniref:Uncharacterized protein n=1 Tax=Pleurodeles waltl TaxID=8319 RepID=A0AAV7SGX4_PLEWA|nr:hypothetical protein NDU88_003785 [Pleurodeles waltl]